MKVEPVKKKFVNTSQNIRQFICIQMNSIRQNFDYIYLHMDTNLFRNNLFLAMFHHSFSATCPLECVYVTQTNCLRESTSTIINQLIRRSPKLNRNSYSFLELLLDEWFDQCPYHVEDERLLNKMNFF